MKLTGKLLTTGLVVGGTFGALALANRLTETQAGELGTVLTGEERLYPWKYGDIFYQVKGNREAKPLVLIHSFAPGASSYEWRKNFDTLAEQFRVYAIDLLGFGLSDRPAIDYTVEAFTDLIGDFIAEVIAKPTFVVAHGLSCAYVIGNAYRRPQLFERLVLVTPPSNLLQETPLSLLDAVQKFVLRLPVIGQLLYNASTSRRAIRDYYDSEGYYNSSLVTDQLVEYLYTGAHQRNARFPMASFYSDNLTMDVYEPLARLQQPVVALWGRESEGQLAPTETSEAFKRVNFRIDTRILDNCKQQLQDEQAATFNNLIREFAGTTIAQ